MAYYTVLIVGHDLPATKPTYSSRNHTNDNKKTNQQDDIVGPLAENIVRDSFII